MRLWTGRERDDIDGFREKGVKEEEGGGDGTRPPWSSPSPLPLPFIPPTLEDDPRLSGSRCRWGRSTGCSPSLGVPTPSFPGSTRDLRRSRGRRTGTGGGTEVLSGVRTRLETGGGTDPTKDPRQILPSGGWSGSVDTRGTGVGSCGPRYDHGPPELTEDVSRERTQGDDKQKERMEESKVADRDN